MLFLVFMIFFVAALVLPLAQEITIQRVRGVISGIIGILLASIFFSMMLAYFGFTNDGVRGALALAFIGASVSTLLVTILSVMSASNDNQLRLH